MSEIGYCSALVGAKGRRVLVKLRAIAAVYGMSLVRDHRRTFDQKLHVDCNPNPGTDAWKRSWVSVHRRPYRVYGGRDGTSGELLALADVAMGLVRLEDLAERAARPKKREKRSRKK